MTVKETPEAWILSGEKVKQPRTKPKKRKPSISFLSLERKYMPERDTPKEAAPDERKPWEL